MTTQRTALDPDRIRELFDLRRNPLGGEFDQDPYPAWQRLRKAGPLHEGTVGRLIGFKGPETFFGLPEPERRHFSAFDFETCDAIVRNREVFRMSPPDPGDQLALHQTSMPSMDGCAQTGVSTSSSPTTMASSMDPHQTGGSSHGLPSDLFGLSRDHPGRGVAGVP